MTARLCMLVTMKRSQRPLPVALQVIAESSEAAVAAVVRSCRGQQLAGKLCDALCHDRSAKLRLCCAEWLLQVSLLIQTDSVATHASLAEPCTGHAAPVEMDADADRTSRVAALRRLAQAGCSPAQVLEQWDDAALERCLAQMGPAIQAACCDAVGEVCAPHGLLLETACWPPCAVLCEHASIFRQCATATRMWMVADPGTRPYALRRANARGTAPREVTVGRHGQRCSEAAYPAPPG